MRFLIALAAVAALAANADAQGCVGSSGCSGSSGGCSGSQARVVVAIGGCSGTVVAVNAGCMGGVGGFRHVATVRVAAAPKAAQLPAPKTDAKDGKQAAAAPVQDQGATFAILEQPRRFFLRLPPRRVAVLVE